MREIIDFCNKNEGALSLLLSCIAVVISVSAIRSQTKSAVFEKRLDVYCRIEDIYCKLARITEVCNKPGKIKRKHIINLILFKLNSPETEIVREILDAAEKENLDPALLFEKNVEIKELADRYSEFCAEEMDFTFENRIALLFKNKEAVNEAVKIFNDYESLKLGFLFYEEDELLKFLEKIQRDIDSFCCKDTLKKLKRDLPI